MPRKGIPALALIRPARRSAAQASGSNMSARRPPSLSKRAAGTGAGVAGGVGTAAASTARDGTLTGTEQDIGTKTGSITNSSGTGVGTAVDGAKTTALNGTATAIDLYLNWSGTAATIDASSYIDVTGTVSVSFVPLGDD